MEAYIVGKIISKSSLEYAGHARDFVRGLDLYEWSGIVVASGDGLVYEVSGFWKYGSG